MSIFSDPFEGIKRIISEHGEKIRLLQEVFADHTSQEVKNDFVECEKCGCLLNRDTAKKGEPIIRKRFSNIFWFSALEDYIYYPYYCKIHAPKVKK